MDVLLEVLKVVRLEGAFFFNAESNLARRVGLSRTRLAERFRYFLEDSPMAYLAKWRLRLGAEMLLSRGDSIAQVAAAVGCPPQSQSAACRSAAIDVQVQSMTIRVQDIDGCNGEGVSQSPPESGGDALAKRGLERSVQSRAASF